MSVEELLEKYRGAYASDFEAPSASGSKESSDSEASGDEEEETEEDESDVESNTSSSGIRMISCNGLSAPTLTSQRCYISSSSSSSSVCFSKCQMWFFFPVRFSRRQR